LFGPAYLIFNEQRFQGVQHPAKLAQPVRFHFGNVGQGQDILQHPGQRSLGHHPDGGIVLTFVQDALATKEEELTHSFGRQRKYQPSTAAPDALYPARPAQPPSRIRRIDPDPP
jgi:hypothetical protein